MQSLLSSRIQKVADSIMKLNEELLPVRKSTILSMNFGRMSSVEWGIFVAFKSGLYNRLLELTAQDENSVINNLDSFTHTRNNKMFVDSVLDGCLLTVTRKAVVLNNCLPPVIVAKQSSLNKIGQPLYHEISHSALNTDGPSTILYMGMC